MIIEDVGILASSSNRTKFYLHQMIKNKLLPSFVLFMGDPSEVVSEEKTHKSKGKDNDKSVLSEYKGFDLSIPLLDLLEKYNIPVRIVHAINPNNKEVVNALKEFKQSIIIYSGPGGIILRKEILGIGKQFLHIHTGLVPHYRGSTTIYYSLINEGVCGATAFFIDENIDTGPVVRQKNYPAPDDRTTIDHYYDPFIRSELLIEVLQYYTDTDRFTVDSQEDAASETYYIIHPTLKHIAILGGN